MSTLASLSNTLVVHKDSPKKVSKEKTFLGFLYFSSEMEQLQQWPELSDTMEARPLEGLDEHEEGEDWRSSIEITPPVAVPPPIFTRKIFRM